MMKMVDWIKTHKLTTLLLLVVGYLLFRSSVGSLFSTQLYNLKTTSSTAYDLAPSAAVNSGVGGVSLPSSGRQETAPAPEVADRMVISESNLSLVVDNIRSRVNAILAETEKRGGYMVSSSITSPEEVPFATLVIRVPSKDLDVMLEYLRSQAIKVTSENLVGRDVTDQYVDYEARLTTLNTTKARFESILASATTVSDIMNVQQQIISAQGQIDSIRGQMQYLEKTAENAKLTIYLSTDEWSLPYAPAAPFRPNVIFKGAVRALVLTLRGLATDAIWIGVYAVIWLPVLLVIIWLVRRRKNVVK
jgi:hypothetical protein